MVAVFSKRVVIRPKLQTSKVASIVSSGMLEMPTNDTKLRGLTLMIKVICAFLLLWGSTMPHVWAIKF